MAFLDPNKKQDDEELAGASGLRLDLDVRICPECRRESLPWQDTCPTCGVATVAPTDVPAERFTLPHLALDDEDEEGDDTEDGGDLADR
jgi:rRNA maturation protein Nop10